jgi:predicted protein tyrosine phosphatase
MYDQLHQILPRVWQTSRDGAVQIDELKERGITHVISVLEERELTTHPWRSAGIPQKTFPLDDSEDETRLPDVMMDVVTHYYATEPRSAVFVVHCAAGICRSTCAVIAIMMWEDHSLTVEAALAKVRRVRACVDPSAYFLEQLRKFREACLPVFRHHDEVRTKAVHLPSGVPALFGGWNDNAYNVHPRLPYLQELLASVSLLQ